MTISENSFLLITYPGRFKHGYFEDFCNFNAFNTTLTKNKSDGVAKSS